MAGSWLVVAAALLGQDTAPAPPVRASFVVLQGQTLQALDSSAKPLLQLNVGEATQLQLHHSGQRVGFKIENELRVVTLRDEAKPVTVVRSVKEWKWAPSGSRLAFRTEQGLYIWNASTPTESAIRLAPGVTAFDWSADGTRLKAFFPNGNGGRLQILSLEGGKPRTILEGHGMLDVAWSPNGRRYAFLKPVLGKPGLANLIVGTVGASNLKNVLKEVQGELAWSPDSKKILVVGPRDRWVVEPAAPFARKLGAGTPSRPEWLSPTRLVGLRDGRLERWDWAMEPFQPTVVATLPPSDQWARTPTFELGNALLADDPFKQLPLPRTGSLNLRGYVDYADPYEDKATLQVSLIRFPGGREQFMARPIPVRLTVPPTARQLGPDLPLRVMDLPFDQEIEVQVSGQVVNDRDEMPVQWAFVPDMPDEGFEDDKSFPKLPQQLNFIWRQAVDAEIVVPMVFPTTDSRIWFRDWWMAPRGGGTRKHIGQDLMGPKMAPMVACFDGVVSIGRNRGNAGHTLTIRHRSGWTAHYYHVNNDTPGTDDGQGGDTYAFAPGIVDGSRVVAGQLVCWNGDSGNAESTGPHIHFELWYEPRRVVVNAYKSLKAARRLSHPRYPDPAPFLRPATQEIRVDGIVSNVNPISKQLSYTRLASLADGKPAQVALAPQWAEARLDLAQIRVRRPDPLNLRPDDIRPGMQISLLAPRQRLNEPRLIAVEGR